MTRIAGSPKLGMTKATKIVPAILIYFNRDTTILLQPCVVIPVEFLLCHECIRSIIEQTCNKTSLIIPSRFLQVVNRLIRTCYNN